MKWAFARWRLHQAVVGLVLAAASALSAALAGGSAWVGIVMLAWLGVLVLVVAPAWLWRDTQLRLTPALSFVVRDEDNFVDPLTGTQYARISVENRSAVALTRVQVQIAAWRPACEELIGLPVPLAPAYGAETEVAVDLHPGTSRSFSFLALEIGAGAANLYVAPSRRGLFLELGTYQARLVASAMEVVPTEQNVEVVATRQAHSQRLEVSW